MVNTVPEFVPGDVLVDGDVRGRYAGEYLQEIAIACGWTGQYCGADTEMEVYYYAQDEAEQYLNDTYAVEPYYFHWAYGSFFYGLSEDDEEAVSANADP